MKTAVLFFLFLTLGTVGFGADSTRIRKKFLVLGLNSVAYRGSLQSSYSRWTPAYQIGIRLEKKRILNGMASLTFGSFIGEDREYKIPSKANQTLSPVSRFKTSFVGIGYEVQILLFKYHGLRLFASQGIGLFRFSVKDWDGNNLSAKDKTRDRGETYSENVLNLPLQLGFQYRFPNDMALGMQAGWLNPLSNYLDNMDALSNNTNSDNVAICRFQFYYPLK
jgi:hypothetical protein